MLKLTFKEAIKLLCEGEHPDDFIRASKYICNLDVAACEPAVEAAIVDIILPQLTSILEDPPKRRQVDKENWVVFWAVMAVSTVTVDREREAVKEGIIPALLLHLKREDEETCCVILKLLAVLSVGYAESAWNQLTQCLSSVCRVIKEELSMKRSQRHAFLLPFAVHALAFTLMNVPKDYHYSEYKAVGEVCGELVEEGEADCSESVLLSCRAMLEGNGRQAAVQAGFLGRVLWRGGRKDYSSKELSPLLFSVLEAAADVDEGRQLGEGSAGMKALLSIMEYLPPDCGLKAIKMIPMLLEEPAVRSPEMALSNAVSFGLVVQLFRLCTEKAANLELRSASLTLMETLIKGADTTTFSAMEIDPFFVLSLLGQVTSPAAAAAASKDSKQKQGQKGHLEEMEGPNKPADTPAILLSRKIVALVIWMCRNGRCDIDDVTSADNQALVKDVENGVHAMAMAKAIAEKFKKHNPGKAPELSVETTE